MSRSTEPGGTDEGESKLELARTAPRSEGRWWKGGWSGLLVVGFLAGVAGGGVGYWAGSHRSGESEGSVVVGRELVLPKEYYFDTASFSEVALEKGELRALAIRFLAELDARLGPLHTASREDFDDRESAWDSERRMERVVDELTEAVEEFGGTAEQTLLLQHLFAVLKREGRHEEWVSRYVAFAYRSPLEPLVGRLAPQALRSAMLCGRQEEVDAVLGHVAGIPLTFETKSLIRAALGRAGGGASVAGWKGQEGRL